MKKIILLIFVLCGIIKTPVYAQFMPPEARLSPGGHFDNVFDRFGNKYRLEDLLINKPSMPPIEDDGMGGRIESTIVPTQLLCSAGYFDLYFESGSGMEGNFSPETDRRAVLCQLFTDLSNFIMPVNPSARVNIWVRNIDNIIPGASGTGVLGLASSFYTMPSINPSSAGIVDGEIWRTINTGADGYTNVTSPLLAQNHQVAGGSGAFYHGMIAFNVNNMSISWHTDLTTPTATGLYDLYSVALHEVTHALGFASLINHNGDSKFGTAYNYYSRYDLFLETQTGQNLITTSSACSMYNYAFNSSLSSGILSPNPSTCGSVIPHNGNLDNTTCTTAVVFAGTVNEAVYTPDCFEPPSSLSHLEDQCHSSSSYSNNQYYCMSDANGTGPTYMKRYLKPEERSVLCDIGYRVNTFYGNSLYSANDYSYGGSQCATMDVAGVNDGVVGGYYMWFAATSGTVNINGIDLLTNDYNADEFECLEVMNGLGTVNITSGNSAASITFTAGSATGIVLLRYIPVNTTTGKRGNITYAYVYIYSGNCTPTACNMIMNGGFESGISCGEHTNSSVTLDCWEVLDWSPDYYVRNCPNWWATIPTGSNVNTPAADTWDNGAGGNDAFLGMGYFTSGGYYIESEQTMLSAPIMPNTTYTLSFWARSAENGFFTGDNRIMFRADVAPIFGSQYNTPFTYGDYLAEVLVTGDQQWHFYTLQFTYSGSVPAGNFLMANIGVGNPNSYVLIDDIVLIPSNNVAEFLPPAGDFCADITTIDNLADYVFPATPAGAVFTGPGVSYNGAVYSFNASGNGVYTIFYTYTNNLGCTITLPAQINATTFQAPTVPMYSAVALGELYADHSHIGNGLEGYYTGAGHIMGGVMYTHPKNFLPADATMVIRTSYDGAVNSPGFFNNSYVFSDPVNGNPLRVTSSRVIELRDGSGYIAVSGFSLNKATPPHMNNQVFGVLYTELDLNGFPVSSAKYVLAPFINGAPFAANNINVTSLKQLLQAQPAVDEFVVTGQITTGEATQIFVLKIDRNGNLHWSGGKMYDLSGMPGMPLVTQEMPMDIIESPFNPNPSAAELHIVGHMDIQGYGRDAFVLTIDPATGLPINCREYDFNSNTVAFNDITTVNYTNDPGFAICGYTHTLASNHSEVLVVKMDENMVPQWSYKYDDANTPGNLNEAYGIKDIPDCRTGDYRFVVAGSRNAFGSRDVMSIEIDASGNASGMDISDLGEDEYAVSVDYIPTGNVTYFSHHSDYSPVSNCYLLFTCMSAHHQVQRTDAFYSSWPVQVNTNTPFVAEDASLSSIITNSDRLLCLAYPSIGMDDNANSYNTNVFNTYGNESPKSNASQGVSLYPNPATTSITLELAKGMSPNTPVKVKLLDITGRSIAELYSGNITGKQEIKLPAVASGLYFVEAISGGNVILKEKLLIEK